MNHALDCLYRGGFSLLSSSTRYAVVTGGASGIGRAFCEHLAGTGWQVACFDIRQPPESHESVSAFVGDVAEIVDWQRLQAQLRLEWPRLDLLVNAAGVLVAGDLADCSPPDIERLVRVNLLGTTWGCRELAPWLAQSPSTAGGFPAIINVASIFALVSPPGFAAYAASKGAVIALSEALRGELHPRGIGVTVAIPGVATTSLFDRAVYSSEHVRNVTLQQSAAATVSPDDVVRVTLRALSRRRLYAIVGRRARLFAMLKRLAPQSLIDFVARRTRDTYRQDS